MKDTPAGAQTGEKPQLRGATARCHRGSAVLRSLLRLWDRAVEIGRGSAAGASPDEV
jgi:hypothetical protein